MEGEDFNNGTVVGIDGKMDGVGKQAVNKKADIGLGGIILGDSILIVVQLEMQGALTVWMCQ